MKKMNQIEIWHARYSNLTYTIKYEKNDMKKMLKSDMLDTQI